MTPLRLGFCLLMLSFPALAGATDEAVLKVRADLKVEDLGAPCRRRLLWDSFVFRAKDSGHLHLYLAFSASNQRGKEPPWQVVDFDLETGAASTAMGSPGGGGRAFRHPNGKLYTGAARPPALVEYDPATRTARNLGSLSDDYYAGPKSEFIDADGVIYIGMYKRNAARCDPATGKVERFGAMGKEATYVYDIAADKRYVYCGMGGTDKWYLVVYDMQTGGQTSYFNPGADGKWTGRIGIAADGTIVFNRGHGEEYRLTDGKPVRLDKPLPPKRGKYDGQWPMTAVEKELGIELDLDEMYPSNWNGGDATIRWRKKGEETWRTATCKGVDIQPNAVYRMAVAPDGKIIGVTACHGALFLFDPKTGKSDCLAAGQDNIYDILISGDMAYFSGYPSMFAVYDRTKPWTMSIKNPRMSKDQNPYRLPGAKWNTHMVEGADGRIYVGGHYGRHHIGGALHVFDPKTREWKAYRDEFAEHAVEDLCVVGPLVVVSAEAAVKDAHGRLMVYDTRRRAFTAQYEPFPDLDGVGNIIPAGDGAVIGLFRCSTKNRNGNEAEGWQLYKLDLADGKLLLTKTGPGRAFNGPLAGTDFGSADRRFAIGPDGCGWFFIDRRLTRIHPGGAVETVRDMPHAARLTFAGDDLYLYSGGRQFFGRYSEVLRIRNVFAR